MSGPLCVFLTYSVPQISGQIKIGAAQLEDLWYLEIQVYY